jgi:hypothetical protein
MNRLLVWVAAVSSSLVATAPASASVRWFYSPSGNISCEVSSGGVRGAYAYCQTLKRPRSVTLHRNGHLTVCRGGRCLGNGPETAKELRYGHSVRVGPFRCTSKQTGMRCVVVSSGHGFAISRGGIRRF